MRYFDQFVVRFSNSCRSGGKRPPQEHTTIQTISVVSFNGQASLTPTSYVLSGTGFHTVTRTTTVTDATGKGTRTTTTLVNLALNKATALCSTQTLPVGATSSATQNAPALGAVRQASSLSLMDSAAVDLVMAGFSPENSTANDSDKRQLTNLLATMK